LRPQRKERDTSHFLLKTSTSQSTQLNTTNQGFKIPVISEVFSREEMLEVNSKNKEARIEFSLAKKKGKKKKKAPVAPRESNNETHLVHRRKKKAPGDTSHFILKPEVSTGTSHKTKQRSVQRSHNTPQDKGIFDTSHFMLKPEKSHISSDIPDWQEKYQRRRRKTPGDTSHFKTKQRSESQRKRSIPQDKIFDKSAYVLQPKPEVSHNVEQRRQEKPGHGSGGTGTSYTIVKPKDSRNNLFPTSGKKTNKNIDEDNEIGDDDDLLSLLLRQKKKRRDERLVRKSPSII
jgi:hypothetical protein